MRIYTAQECPQGSDIWWTVRKGIPTASGFSRIVTSKGKPSKSMDKYIAELIADESMQCPTYFTTRGRPVTKAMTNGTDCEPEARRFYEMARECTVTEVGFCLHDSGLFGCSPDGLVGEDGGLELKCPEAKTQAEYLLKNRMPPEYVAQVHGSLIVTGRKWWDFLSYAHGLEPLLIRVEPNEFTEQLRSSLDVFLEKLADAKKKLITKEKPMTQPTQQPKKKPTVEEVMAWFRENIPLAANSKTRTPNEQLAWISEQLARLDREVGFTKEQGDELGCLWYVTSFSVCDTVEWKQKLCATASTNEWSAEHHEAIKQADEAAAARLGIT